MNRTTKHTITIDGFDGFVGKTTLASDSKTSRFLNLISKPASNEHYYEVLKATQVIGRYRLDEFQAAIDDYNKTV